MHSIAALVWCLKVCDLKWEWWLDLPELASIQLGEHAFGFSYYSDSNHLVMRSRWIELLWWLDLPKLTSLSSIGKHSSSFELVHHISLESDSSSSFLTTRHAFSCWSQSASCFLLWLWVFSSREFSFILSVTPRHWCSCSLCSLPCLFHQGVVMVVFPWGYSQMSLVRQKQRLSLFAHTSVCWNKQRSTLLLDKPTRELESSR